MSGNIQWYAKDCHILLVLNLWCVTSCVSLWRVNLLRWHSLMLALCFIKTSGSRIMVTRSLRIWTPEYRYLRSEKAYTLHSIRLKINTNHAIYKSIYVQSDHIMWLKFWLRTSQLQYITVNVIDNVIIIMIYKSLNDLREKIWFHWNHIWFISIVWIIFDSFKIKLIASHGINSAAFQKSWIFIQDQAQESLKSKTRFETRLELWRMRKSEIILRKNRS